MVLSAMGTLSDRRIGDALACHTNDERYKKILKNRMQRRRGGDKIQRSYSCEDLTLAFANRSDKINIEQEEEGQNFKRASSSVDRSRKNSHGSRQESPDRDEDVRRKYKDEIPQPVKASVKKSKRGGKTKREKKGRIRERTKTVSFPTNSLLHYAVLQNNVAMVTKLLKSQSVDTDILSQEGTAPLHEAAVNGFIACAELLLEHDADVNVLDAEGYTPLEYAVYAGQFDCASLLISLGANVAKIKDGCYIPLPR